MVTQTPHLWNSLPNSAIIQDVSGALPGVDADTPACGTAMQDTAQPALIRCNQRTAHRVTRYVHARFPFRKKVAQLTDKPLPTCKHCGIATDELCLGVCYDCVGVLS